MSLNGLCELKALNKHESLVFFFVSSFESCEKKQHEQQIRNSFEQL